MIVLLCKFSIFLWYILQINCNVIVNLSKDSELIDNFSGMICESHIKVLYVYFDKKASLGHSGQILRQTTGCGVSFIILRNTFETTPKEMIKDDGILMYLAILLNDVSQPLELSIIKKKSAAKHLSHVFLLINDSNTLTRSWMHSTFRRFWQIWVLNVVIIYWRENKLHIYRYNPFVNKYLIEVPFLEPYPSLSELFPKVIPDMQRKPLRMCIFPDEIRAIYIKHGNILGTDGFMSSYVAQRLNATRIVDRAHPYGKNNISADICFKEVAYEYDDVSMNIRFLSPETFYKLAEATVAHKRDDLCVIVPKAEIASTVWNLFRSFRGCVWTSIALSVVLANFFCALINKEYMSLQLFACILSQPFTCISHVNSVRVFLVFFIYFSMLICTAFRGNLTSMLVFNKYLPDVNTIEDLALSNYKILVRARHVKHIDRFLETKNPLEYAIRRNMKIVSDETFLDYFNENDKNFAYLEKNHVASFQISARRHMRFGRPLFHLMETCLVPFHAVYIVPFGSPYLGFINNLIRSSYEFGFETYWDRIMNSAFIKSGRSYVNRQRDSLDDPVVLKLHHLQGIFCIWFAGLCLPLLVFVCEMLIGRKTTFFFK